MDFVSEQSGPRVLMLATGMWMSTARLAMALRSLGCEVELMARRRHPAMMAGLANKRYGYRPLQPVQSVLDAIRAAKPDAVIPVDELAVLHLEELRAAAEMGSGAEEQMVRALLQRCGGGARAMTLGRSRNALMELAVREGVAVPETVAVDTEGDLEAAIARLGLPSVLKADATFGGRGVRVVESLAEARAAWRRLHRAPSVMDAARRGLVWSEWSHIRPWARGETRAVVAQRMVLGGRERTAMAMTFEGKMLASVCMEVVETTALRGPSSVVRVIADETMEAAMRAVAGEVGVSGFCGFDFMVKDGKPLLIEMNLRPTQLAHLPLGPGRDLVAAFARAVLGMDVADRPAATEGDVIALFPQELLRDETSAWIREGFHDVPWERPELVGWAWKGKLQ
jgi:biotin carboxylase